MALFGRIFGGDKNPSVVRVRKAVRRDQLRFNPKTAASLSELTAGPLSEELVDLLIELAGGGPYCKIAEAALGSSGHPRAIARLLHEIERNGLRAKEAVEPFSNPVNRGAVGELARIARTSSRFGSVQAATAALEKMGTPEAQKALNEFAEAPPRELYCDTAEGERGLPIGIYRPSSDITRRRWKLKPDTTQTASASANIFLSDNDHEFENALQKCLASPDNNRGLVRRLFTALSHASDPTTADRVSGTSESIASPIESAPTSGSERLRRRLAQEDTSHLETHLLNGVARGNQANLHDYLSLPRRRPIGELPGLVASFNSLTEIQNYASASAHRAAQGAIEQARARFDDVEYRLAAFDRAYANLASDERLSLLQEFIEPLLRAPDWSSRRRAIESLAKLPKLDREPGLSRFLSSGETDFDLLQRAKTALNQP